MDSFAQLGKLVAQDALTDLGHSALPNAPVQPYRPRRPTLAQRYARLKQHVERVLGRRPASRQPATTPAITFTIVGDPRTGWRDGEGDTADDRGPCRREPDDGLERVLPARSAVG